MIELCGKGSVAGKKGGCKKSCASSKVAIPGGGVGVRAGTGGRLSSVSDGVLRLADRGCQPILDAPDYTTFGETVNAFL